MPKTEILMTAPMLPAVMKRAAAEFELHRLFEAKDREAFLKEVGPRIRGLAVSGGHARWDGAFFDKLPNLKIAASFGVGYDNVDAVEAARRGIVVTNTPGVLDDEVADFAVGLLLATLRKIPHAERHLRDGRWLEGNYPLGATLRGRKVGIVGLGRIGKAIARRVAAFDVEILYHGRTRQADVPYPYYPTVLALAEAADVLIVITPGGSETKHLVDAKVLRALGPEGILINVARGSVVDEEALVEALRDNAIQGAGLDVFAEEPRVPQALLEMEHVVLTPHIASASVHTRTAMGMLVLDNLASFFAGKGPLTPVPETPWKG